MIRFFWICLALFASAANALTLHWDSGPDWPAGTTVDACVNAECLSGIAGNERAFDVAPGTAIDARVRAIAPDGRVSDWAMLSQTMPPRPAGFWADRESGSALMAVEYKGYALVTGDYDGSVSQSVTVPSGATYALAYVGADTSRTFSAISLGGAAMTSIVTGTGAYGVNRLWGVATTEGSKTFAYTASGSFAEGGVAVLLFFANVDSVRSSTGSGINSLGTLSLGAMTSQSGDLAVIVGLQDAYSSPTAQDVDLNSQTKIIENNNYNYRGYGAAYKTATGTSIVMQMYGDWPAACGAVLVPTVGGDASVSLQGANGSAAVGLLGLSGTADKSLTGVASSGAVGTVSTQVLLSLLGNALSGAAGTITSSGAANKTLSGISGTGAAGTPSMSGSGATSLSGNSATGNIGAPSISGGANLSLSGVSIATAAGIISLSGASNVALPGVFITGQIGNITASAGGSASVSLSGNAASGAIGTLTLSGAAGKTLSGVTSSGAIGGITFAVSKSLSGVSATGNAGNVTLSANALLSLLGVSSSASAGIISVSAGGTITLVGVSATGQIGTVTASAGSPATITLSGAASVSAVGTLALRGDALVLLPGATASGQAGTVRLVEIITPGGRLLLVESDDRILIVQSDDRNLLVMSDDSNLTIN